jgi:hypothetical protein
MTKQQSAPAFEQALDDVQQSCIAYGRDAYDETYRTSRATFQASEDDMVDALLAIRAIHLAALSRARAEERQKGTKAIAEMMIRFWTDWAAQNPTLDELSADIPICATPHTPAPQISGDQQHGV